MREIKLSGREVVVVRALGFAYPVTGEELLEATKIEADSLVDILNALMSAGYVESTPYAESTTVEQYATSAFETNASFSQELKKALGRGRER